MEVAADEINLSPAVDLALNLPTITMSQFCAYGQGVSPALLRLE